MLDGPIAMLRLPCTRAAAQVCGTGAKARVDLSLRTDGGATTEPDAAGGAAGGAAKRRKTSVDEPLPEEGSVLPVTVVRPIDGRGLEVQVMA